MTGWDGMGLDWIGLDISQTTTTTRAPLAVLINNYALDDANDDYDFKIQSGTHLYVEMEGREGLGCAQLSITQVFYFYFNFNLYCYFNLNFHYHYLPSSASLRLSTLILISIFIVTLT